MKDPDVAEVKAEIFLVSNSLFHESLTALSLHQTQIQRSTILLEGAGPLSQGRVPTATWPGRGGPHRRRHLRCPARSLRRRNTSTYPCCWRRPASAPPTTPLTKVTDKSYSSPPLAVESDRNVSLSLVTACVFVCVSLGQLFFLTVLKLDDLYLSCCWLLYKSCLVFKKSYKPISMVFYIAWIANRFL